MFWYFQFKKNQIAATLFVLFLKSKTFTQGPAGSSHHLPEVPLGKVLSSICALSGMGQVISKLFLTRSNLFRDKKKEIMETMSNM